MPNLAALAARGEVGRAATIPDGLPAGSDVGNLSILGYDPARYHTGRAPIEAAALGVELAPGQVAFRCNLVTVGSDGTMVDFAGGHPSSQDAARVIAALEAELGDNGGLRRYADDTYAGGNNWVLAALWLGLWHRQVGDDAGLARALEYTVSVQTKLGLLPEQVTATGDPAWVVPLAWSHAMLLLAARPELTLIRTKEAAAAQLA